MIRRCECCGRELVRGVGERGSRWAVRRFCGVLCANESKIRRRPARVCETCGAAIPRRQANGKLVDVKRYAQRRHCSVACRDARRSRPPVVAVEVAPVMPCGDWLRTALRVHPDLVSAFEEVEQDVSLDAWEPYSQAAVKGVTA